DADAYVVNQAANGVIIWAFVYDIGGRHAFDSAYDIEQDPAGNFIVTGSTTVNGTLDLFLMKLNPLGGVIWVETFGAAGDEQGRDVMVAANGDYVVDGWTTSFGAGGQDGWVIRTTNAGVQIWANTYGLFPDEFFHGLNETVNGDLLACGATKSFGNAWQAWVVRLTGLGGVIWTNHYGGLSDEVLHSITELQVPPFAGVIVTCGYTTDAPSLPMDFYVLRLNAAGVYAMDVAAGGMDQDEMFWIRELRTASPLPSPPYPPGTTTLGNLILVGRSIGGGFLGNNVYAVEMLPNWNCGFGKVWSRIYGGNGEDEGRSVAEVPMNAAVGSTPGLIIAGFTQSAALVPPGDPQQEYVIKTDAFGSSNCNDAFPPDGCRTPVFRDTQAPILLTATPGPAITQALQLNAVAGVVLCFINPAPAGGDPSQGAPREEVGNEAGGDASHFHDFMFDEVRGNGSSTSGVPSVSEDASSTYPNPVTAGTTFRVQYTMPNDGRTAITVTDVLGKEVFTYRNSVEAGARLVPVNTTGWPAGTYLVKLEMGSRSMTKQIVVLGK
ncbi:MAG: T9SS type A sorting domain-containing protein, partial [Candidatus Kapaibacterium sp.]